MHVVINGWFLGQTTAGSGQYLHHLLARLPQAATGVEFSLLLPPSADRPRPADDDFAGVAVVRPAMPPLPHPYSKLWWEQVAVPATARRLQADVLWAPYWAAPAWQPCPVVVTVHDLIPALLPAYHGGPLRRTYTALVSWTARRAMAVLTVSHASAGDIAEHLGVEGNRIHVVHHGPNQEEAATPGRAELIYVRAKYGLPERYFLYLGGFDVRKNLRGILHAYRGYLDRDGDPEVRLVIAGALPGRDSDFAPDPQKIAAELNLGDRVQFCGWIDEGDKPALYALSTAFIFPSLYEGFGMMLLEAMQAGTPVITSG